MSLGRALVARDEAQRATAFESLLPELLRGAPAMAVEIFARQEPGDTRDTLRDELARQWIVLDREAASAWIDALAADERAAASTIAMRALASRSAPDALEFARRFEVGGDDGSLEHLVQIWALEDPEAALNWIEAQTRDAWNDRLRVRIEAVRRKSRVSGI